MKGYQPRINLEEDVISDLLVDSHNSEQLGDLLLSAMEFTWR